MEKVKRICVTLIIVVFLNYGLMAQSNVQIAPPPFSVMPPNKMDYKNLKITYLNMSSGDVVSGSGYKLDYYDNAILNELTKDSIDAGFGCLHINFGSFSIGTEFMLPLIDASNPLNPIITENQVDFTITTTIIGARMWTGTSGIKYDIAGEIIEHKFGMAISIIGFDYYKFSSSGLDDYNLDFSDELFIYRAGVVMDLPLSKYFSAVPFYDYGRGKKYKSSTYGLDINIAPFENARDWKISLGTAINTAKANENKNKFWQISITKEWGNFYESTTIGPF